MALFLDIVFYEFLVYFCLCASVTISLRLLKYPDLSIDAAYALGMVIVFLVSSAFSKSISLQPLMIVITVVIGSTVFGYTLSALNQIRFIQIERLICGLVVLLLAAPFLFRLNGQATSQGLYNLNTIANTLRTTGSDNQNTLVFLVLFILVLIIFIGTTQLFRSTIGLKIIAAGSKGTVVRRSGRSSFFLLGLGLSVSSLLAIVAGLVRASLENYSDINTFGSFMFALAGVLCGERIMGLLGLSDRLLVNFYFRVISVLTGAIAVSIILAVSVTAINLIFDSYFGADLRFAIGVVIIILASRLFRGSSILDQSGSQKI